MTRINLYGILAQEYGESFCMKIDNARDVFDALDANREGFKKRIFELNDQGFSYCLVIDGEKIKDKESFISKKSPSEVDIAPVLGGSGEVVAMIIIAVVSVGVSLLLAPDPPKPPEISATAESLEKSFTFSSLANRAAQGTPIPIGYGELILGSEVIQTSLKSYPQNQRALTAMARNPFNTNESPTTSESQFAD